MIILVLLSRKEWRILIRITSLIAGHDNIGAFIYEGIKHFIVNSIHDDIDSSV